MSVYNRNNVRCVKWSEADIQLLTKAHTYHGNNWVYICQHYFPDRSPHQVKCKYNYQERKRQKSEGKQAQKVQTDVQYQQQIREEIVCNLNQPSFLQI
ncbi:Myb-like_DNA-binding domain-containing protein [Hexamita inflata]|uniref:Myb-like_DNA-binding domain-containing protein n=1 Tax=Hexamita inflata TaxID=28002 RepID=A0ABP1HDD0_9EUKA